MRGASKVDLGPVVLLQFVGLDAEAELVPGDEPAHEGRVAHLLGDDVARRRAVPADRLEQVAVLQRRPRSGARPRFAVQLLPVDNNKSRTAGEI